LLLESNKQELSEFSLAYINFPIILFIVLSGILFFIIRKNRFKTVNKHRLIIGLLGFIAIVVFLKLSGLIESNAYHNIVRGTYGYVDLQNSVKFNSIIDKEEIKVTANNEVLVVVLGESTAREHMQIYGYNRETTPLLNSIKDSLFIYDDVISTDVFTLKAVPKILTSLDIDSKNEETTNLVEFFNAAGYKTFWLSNQRPISYHDNVTSKIASKATMFKFYNHIIDKNTLVLDEIMFEDYGDILKESGKKVIFIRLIGTHFNYDKRYPESFNKFKTDDKLSKEQTIINQYDNAILYNDFIVYSLIEILQKNSKKSALLYISDHGENVYDDGTDFFGRSEEIITESMFEIPFLLWTSKDFTFPNDFEYNPHRKFMADHTYESIGHIFGVIYKNMDAENSIFSNSFKTRKRKIIDNTLDFDKYFGEK
jgi:heptose-I-phosphate ethanolaminephosphotransferase